MTTREIISEIYKNGSQREVFDILYHWILNDHKKLESENAELRACKKAISKINASKYKDEAIDALSE